MEQHSSSSFEQLIDQARQAGGVLVIDRKYDLKGRKVNIDNLKLDFRENALLANGTLIGNGSTHQSIKKQCYQNVRLKGKWTNDEGYLEWFVGTDRTNSFANFQAICSIIEMGAIVKLEHIYPIATRTAKSYYATSKPIRIEGKNTREAGLILETKHVNVFYSYFKHDKGNSLSLKNLSLKTRDFINGIYSNKESDYLFSSSYYRKEYNPEARPQIEYIKIEGCHIEGAIAIAAYGTHSDNQSLQSFGKENKVDLVSIKNNVFNYCNAPLAFANMGFREVLIQKNEVKNISSAFINFSASGIPDEYKMAVFANRGLVKMTDNFFHNDHPIQVPTDRAMTTMVIKGGDGELFFQNNRLENMTSTSKDADAHYLYYTCTPKGKAVIVENVIKNVVGRGSINYPATLVKQRAAYNLVIKNNHFEITKEALVDIGVLTSVNDKISDLSGNDFYIDFMQIGTSQGLGRKYEITNNTFITPLINKSSLIHDVGNFRFEDNTLRIEHFGRSNIESTVSKDGVLFYGRYRVDRQKDAAPGNFISRNNTITIGSSDFSSLYYTYYPEGVQNGSLNNTDNQFNYKEVIFRDKVFSNNTNLVFSLLDGETQVIETIIKGKNSSISVFDMANVNHQRPNNKQLKVNSTFESFRDYADAPLFTVAPNSTQQIKVEKNNSDEVTLLKFGTYLMLYNLKKDLPLLLKIRIDYVDQELKRGSNTYNIILDGKYRSFIHLSDKGKLKNYSPSTNLGRKEIVKGDGPLAPFNLALLHGEESKKIPLEVKLEGIKGLKSFDIEMSCTKPKGEYNSVSKFLKTAKQSSVE